MNRVKALLLVSFSLQAAILFAQPGPRAELSPTEAKNLAELMCRQIPNVATLLENHIILPSTELPPPPPPEEPETIDDVYDALAQLGPYSVPCLTDRLLDTHWTLDPRTEPLLGAPLVGDVAYMILQEKGVPDFIPRLSHKKRPRMDDYFLWPRVGDHRKQLQNAVRAWLAKHPDCCGAQPSLRETSPTQLKFRMSRNELYNTRTDFSRLRLGMSPEEVLTIRPSPDAIDQSGDPDHWHQMLLGYCANDHNENLAYIYFIERWADEIARRDPLRDHYVIVFFSAERKLTRMFSNITDIPPMFPRSETTWQRLAWGEPEKNN
jgi:hypothetical protein